MGTYQQNSKTGAWEPATPLGPQGIVAKLEFWLRGHGFKKIPMWLAKFDERKLGR